MFIFSVYGGILLLSHRYFHKRRAIIESICQSKGVKKLPKIL